MELVTSWVQTVIAVATFASVVISGYVAISIKSLRNEFDLKIAEQERALFEKINGTYVRSGECRLREDHMVDKLLSIEKSIYRLVEINGENRHSS